MAAEKKLAFLISDDSICYGANYPFSHVVVEEGVCTNHSIGTIFQLIGRAGRVGQSWVAKAYVGDQTTKRIMDYIRGSEGSGGTIEAVNINIAFQKALVEEAEHKKNPRSPNVIKLCQVKPKSGK